MQVRVAVLLAMLVAASQAAAQTPCSSRTVSFGTDQSGAVEPSDCSLAPFWNGVGDSWAFELNAGDLVTFQLLRGTMRDVHALVVSPSGIVIAATNGYFDGDRQCCLSVQASASGVYRILITSGIQGGTDFGTYLLRSRVITTPAAPFLQSATVDYGQFRASWYAPLSPTAVVEYQLEISTAPGKQDVGVFSVAPAGTYTVYLATVVHGYYFARVRARNSYGWGAYSAEIETYVNPLPPRAPCLSTPLLIGTTQYGAIEPSDCPLRPLWMGVGDEWSFNLTAGETASFELLPGTMTDPFGIVVNPAGAIVELTNGFSNGKRNRSFWVTAPAPGVYRVIVTAPQENPHYGTYVLHSSGPGGPAPSPAPPPPAPAPAPVPNAPCCLTAAAAGSRVQLTWVRSAGEAVTFFEVIAGSFPGGSDIGSVNVGNVASVTFDNVPSGRYYARVRAWNNNGASPASNEVEMQVGSSVPSAPQLLSAIVTAGRVRLNWSPPAVGGAAAYELFAGTIPGVANIGTIMIGANTTLEFANVPPGRYYVRLRAWNGRGAGAFSQEIIVTVN